MIILRAYYNDISGKDATILTLDALDEQIANAVLTVGAKLPYVVLEKLTEKLGLNSNAVSAIKTMEGFSGKAASTIASYINDYSVQLIDVLGKMVEESITDLSYCNHLSKTFVAKQPAEIFKFAVPAHYECDFCGKCFSAEDENKEIDINHFSVQDIIKTVFKPFTHLISVNYVNSVVKGILSFTFNELIGTVGSDLINHASYVANVYVRHTA